MPVMDLNEAEGQRDFTIIPDGTFAMLKMIFKRGGQSIPGDVPADAGLYQYSKPNAQGERSTMIEAEFIVLNGPHAKRRINFQYFTVIGGAMDENGNYKSWNIAKQFFRAVIESALGIDPKDESPAAKAKRQIPSLSALDGIEFPGRIDVELGTGNFPDKNRVRYAVTPDQPEWAILRRGEIPPPRPTQRSTRPQTAAPTKEPQPAWQQAAAPAVAPPSPAAWQQAAAPPVSPAAQQPNWGQGAPQQPALPQSEPATAPAPGPAWLRQVGG
jgi:hypothetical protein